MTTTTTRPRPIVLRDDEVREIISKGRVAIWRPIKPQPCDPSTFGSNPIWGSGVRLGENCFSIHCATNVNGKRVDRWIACPFGKVGDKVWFKEAWGYYAAFGKDVQPGAPVIYRADRDECGQYPCKLDGRIVLVNDRDPWRSATAMPPRHSRLRGVIAGVSVEQRGDVWGWLGEFEREGG